MRKLAFLVMSLLLVMVGCGKDKESDQSNGAVSPPALIEVTIHTPETININEEVKLEATVTQGDELVDDANEVKFEVWKIGEEEHEKVDATNDGKGVYSIKKTFTEDGHYSVIAHVTARSMHSMPKQDFTVGTPAENTVSEENTGNSHHEDSGHGHHETALKIESNQENATVAINQDIELSTTLTLENTPLLGATVRFEIIPEDESKKEWIDATEDGAGVYTAKAIFKTAGMYHVQIHVNKDEIHDHKILMIEVK
ncbi:FixH family protein [Pseudoneobacillus sp. C159]